MSIKSLGDDYVRQGKKRWHTPGHKGTLAPFDLTEIDCKSGEIFPSCEVEKAQEKAAKFYGAKYCRFLVGGSSMGIKAAIMSAGGDILAPVNRHRCVDEGAALARVKVFDMESAKQSDGLFNPPTAMDIERAVKSHPSATAVVVVSPDYYGVCADEKIAEKVRALGKIFIADSAHGAHFAARKDLFGEGYSGKADICVMSAHKTMQAYTQSSYLCCNNAALIDSIDYNLRLLGTTSPSYLLLSSLEGAVKYAEKNAARYDELKAAADDFRTEIVCRKSDDFTRIVVDASHYGKSGRELFESLYRHGQVAELYDERYVIFILTLADSADEVTALKEQIKRIANER